MASVTHKYIHESEAPASALRCAVMFCVRQLFFNVCFAKSNNVIAKQNKQLCSI